MSDRGQVFLPDDVEHEVEGDSTISPQTPAPVRTIFANFIVSPCQVEPLCLINWGSDAG